MGEAGSAERAELFRLLPRLLRVLPTAGSHSALTALYPALSSAARHDPCLTALTAVSPLLAHVVAAAIARPSDAARDAVACLAQALAVRPGTTQVAAALLRDLVRALRALKTITRKPGNLPILEEFARAAIAAKDIIPGPLDSNVQTDLSEATSTWPYVPILLDCSDELKKPVTDLVECMLYSRLWICIGAAARATVVHFIVQLGETSLLLALQNSRKTSVPLSRPLLISVNNAIKSCCRSEILANCEVNNETPPRKKARTSVRLQFDACHRIESQLNAVSGMMWNEDACMHVASLCPLIQRLENSEKRRAIVEKFIDVGMALLTEMGVAPNEQCGNIAENDNSSVLMISILEMAFAFVELTAKPLGMPLQESSQTDVSAFTSVHMGCSQGPSLLQQGPSELSQNSRVSEAANLSLFKTVLPTVISVLYTVLNISVRTCATRRTGQEEPIEVQSITTIVLRASMLLWRVSDVCTAVTLDAKRFQTGEARNPMNDSSQVNSEFIDISESIGNMRSVVSFYFETAVDGSAMSYPRARAALLRSSSRALACHFSNSRSLIDNAILRAEALARDSFARNDNLMASSSLYAVADLFCASVLCRHCILRSCRLNVIDEHGQDSKVCSQTPPFNSTLWGCLHDLVRPIVTGIGHSATVGAAARLLSRLVMHAPITKFGMVAADLVQAIWHPTSAVAGEESVSAVHALLTVGQLRAAGDGTAEMPSQERIGERQTPLLAGATECPRPTEDTWDGPNAAFRNDVDSEKDRLGKLLMTEVQCQLSRGDHTLQDPRPLSRLSMLSVPSACSASKAIALATESLISAAVTELCDIRKYLKGSVANYDGSFAPKLGAWTELIFVSANSVALAMNCEGGVWVPSRCNGPSSSLSLASLRSCKLLPVICGLAQFSRPKFSEIAVGTIMSQFLVSRYKHWIPIALPRLLQNEEYTRRLTTILGESNVDTFWQLVPKYALGRVLRDGCEVTLESLSRRTGKPSRELVEQVCSDALARGALLNPLSLENENDPCNNLIRLTLQQPLAEIIKARIGKLVQRLVMEFGNGRDEAVKLALASLGRIVQDSGSSTVMTAPELVTEHFLLVMDAINRGLFVSWISKAEQHRCILILDAVVQLCRDALPLFVPKVMATLKMAMEMEGADLSFREIVCQVWVNFMCNLGPLHVGPHFGSFLTILAPYLKQHHGLIAPTLCELFSSAHTASSGYASDIALLIATIGHPSLAPIAATLGDKLPRIALYDNSRCCETAVADCAIKTDETVAIKDPHLVSSVEQVLNIAIVHDSDAIRELALDRLLTILKLHRGWLHTELVSDSDELVSDEKRGLLSRLVYSCTNLLQYSGNRCRTIALKCLGELGALDPACLSTFTKGSDSVSPRKGRPTLIEMSHPEKRKLPQSLRVVAIEILTNILVPSLLRGDRSGTANLLNRLGLAIQEVLTVCGCGIETPELAEHQTDDIQRSLLDHGDEWETKMVERNNAALAVQFWGRLNPEVRRAVQPYLARPFDTASYNAKAGQAERVRDPDKMADDILQSRGPIWKRLASVLGDAQGTQLTEWRMQMTIHLTEFIGIRGKFGLLFRALRPVMRHVDNVSWYLLPVVIMEALDCDGLAYAKRGQESSWSRAEYAAHMAKYCRTEAEESVLFKFLRSEIENALSTGGEAAQYLFTVLDTLRRWRDVRAGVTGCRRHSEEKNQAVGAARRRFASSEGEYVTKAIAEDVLTLLVDLEGRSKFSLPLMARAAYQSRAFSRAVLYAEQNVRNCRREVGASTWPAFVSHMVGGIGLEVTSNSTPGDEAFSIKSGSNCEIAARDSRKKIASIRGCGVESDSLSLLQRCYFELEDSDSMSSIASLRHHTSLREAILDSESAACFDDALLGYEHALAKFPRDISLQNGFLRCLRTLGHWETMLAHADGIGHSAAGAGTSLDVSVKGMGIEAAWRLGRWERVEDICESVPLSLDDVVRETATSSLSEGGLGILHGHDSSESAFGLAVGRMLICVRQRDVSGLSRIADEARSCLLGPAANAAMEGYDRAYPFIVKLHVLADIEDTMRHASEMERINRSNLDHHGTGDVDTRRQECAREYSMSDVLQRANLTCLVGMHERSALTTSSLHVREPILSCRRVCLELLDRPCEAAMVSLQLAKIARESGNLRAAAAAAYRTMSTIPSDSHEWFAASIENAKIKAARGDLTSALLSLEKDIDRMTRALHSIGQDLNQQIATETVISASKLRLAAAHVLAGQWIEDARNAPTDAIVEHYRLAAKLAPDKDEAFYALGRFYNSLLLASNASSRGHAAFQKQEYVPLIIFNFSEALRLGHTYLFEILPRMLTVWFDFYSIVEIGSAAHADIEKRTRRVIQQALATIPKYMWMTVVPQLMSRLLHPNNFVRQELHSLLASIVMEFPDQAIWMIAPSSQLKAMERRDAAGDILNKCVQVARKKSNGRTPAEAKLYASELKRRIRDGLVVIKHLIDVCMTQPPKDKRGRTDCCTKEFARMREDVQASSIIVPTLAALTVSMPRAEGSQSVVIDGGHFGNANGFVDNRSHNPFAAEPITIADVETTVLVMSSLMRPRRIGFLGSDGKVYRFLSKRETSGDMRKDSRLMDFLTVVNRLLAKQPDAHRRDMYLKTYAVIPLSEETGLLEWVNDIAPLRIVVREEQLKLGPVPDTNAIQTQYQALDKRRFLEEWAIPKFPAVLDKYFLHQFGHYGDPKAWLAARTRWTRSVAAWSMTGYIVGLGDRHGENILVESNSGMCVHVDFAILFDKGLTLKVPEIVPFRLTQNIVCAMGIAGYEGSFRVACEIVMGVLRGNSDALMGVLESFLHDPLADWTKGAINTARKGSTVNGFDAGDEGNNKYATDMRRAVEAKLRGLVGGAGLPLSIKGQVQRLISEAASTENLSKMYLWWTAWC